MGVTAKDIKKEDRLCMKSLSPEQRHSAKGVFQIHSILPDVNSSNDIEILQVRVNIKETEHDTTFEIC